MATEAANRPVADESAEEDDAPKGVYHFLDVGGAKYGECVLVEFDGKRVLIDGSHQQDFKGQKGYQSIPEQLQGVLGGRPPYAIDLIVVTHCHADHIGCLPDLVDHGIIQPRHALLTDPKAGFGRSANDDADVSASSPTSRLEAALREEDATDLDDAGLEAFIDAAVAAEPRYGDFIDRLEASGARVHIHRGGPLPDAIATDLSATGITLFGPTEDQILLCAEQISKTNKEAQDAIARDGAIDASDVASLYRRLMAQDDVDAGYTRGNAMNCQSITLAFGPPGARVLLAGDMQFAEPGVRGIDNEVAALRRAVIAAGPYMVYKTTHHTSHNGQDDAFLDALGSPSIIVHSGGLRDDKHPFPGLLTMLKGRRNMRFARTDRNGIITVVPEAKPDQAITITRGELNDFEPNISPDEREPQPARREPSGQPVLHATSPTLPPPTSAAGPQIIIVNLPPGPIDMSVAGVDIVVRDPRTNPRTNVVVSNGPSQTTNTAGGIRRPDQGGDLSGLLFVTDPDRLRTNIGRAEADEALTTVASRGGTLLEGSGDGLSKQAIDRLSHPGDVRGVVLVGGYDVVPAHRVDSLGPDLRTKLADRIAEDGDQFWVWSDEAYADTDGDGLAEIPVSRIPDARDARMLRAALRAGRAKPAGRFGVRNVARPFADGVWAEIQQPGEMRVSKPYQSAQLVPADAAAEHHYIMLHGDHRDGRTFEGEDGMRSPVAFEVGQVPSTFEGIVFAGCCWGALTVDGRAFDHANAMPAPRLVESSIALSYIKAGALAFIGCTGSHYSGTVTDPDANYAFRLHQAFWQRLRGGDSPASALFGAKQDYARLISAAGALDPLDTGRRLKNLSQFTCLGLGWA